MADAQADQRRRRAITHRLIVDLFVSHEQHRALEQEIALDQASFGVGVERRAIGCFRSAREIVGLRHPPHESRLLATARRAPRRPVARVQPAIGEIGRRAKLRLGELVDKL